MIDKQSIGHMEALKRVRLKNFEQVKRGKVPDMCKGYYKKGLKDGYSQAIKDVEKIINKIKFSDDHPEARWGDILYVDKLKQKLKELKVR